MEATTETQPTRRLLNLSLDPELEMKLRIEAATQRRPISHLANDILRKHFDENSQ